MLDERLDQGFDEDLGRILAGLREASAPPGMNARTLRAIKLRASAGETPRRWPLLRIRGLRPALALPVALACAVALLGVFLLAPRHRQQWRQVAVTARPEEFPPASVPSPSVPVLTRRAGDANAAATRAVILGDLKRERATERGRGRDQQAGRAESFPPPPLPLTEQERLLLRVARRRNPADAAILNPVLQATLIASEQAQFERFFTPPPPPQPEVQPEVKPEVEEEDHAQSR